MHTETKNHYFDHPLSKAFVALYSSRTILLVASGLLGIFVPIFLFDLFRQNLGLVIAFYTIQSLLYVLVIPATTRMLNTVTFRTALKISTFVGALIYILYYFLEDATILYIIPLIIFFSVLWRALYWLPYHVDFAKFTDLKDRGRQLSMLRATQLLVSVGTPIAAGFIVERYGFDILFIFGIVLYLLSGIPYKKVPPTNETFSWSYLHTWKEFISRKNKKVFLAYAADGAEGIVSVVIWPIFIFGLLSGDYLLVGGISTLIVAITILLQLSLGTYIDKRLKKGRVLRAGSLLYAIGWVIKIFISTAFHIFIIGAYHSITQIFTRTPFDTLTYEMSADEGHYVDEFTVLKEMALHTGRFAAGILIIIISFFFAIQWVFIIAALASIFLNLIDARDVHLRAPILK